MRKSTTSRTNLVYDLRVTLHDVTPEVWRLVRLPHDLRMDRLHDVLQVAFGWTNSHLHLFQLFDDTGKIVGYVGQPDPDFPEDSFGDNLKTEVETKHLLKNFLAQPGDRIGYEYDFGDSWHHEITLVVVHLQTARLAKASCLDGARAGPPEDCGGPPGYENFVAAVRDPQHPEHHEMLDWIGGEFDPEAFDLAKTNRALGRLKV